MTDSEIVDQYLLLDENGFYIFAREGWQLLGAIEYLRAARAKQCIDLIRLRPNGSIVEFNRVLISN